MGWNYFVCDLQNRICYKKTSKTFYELWKSYVSNLKKLKVWGYAQLEILKSVGCLTKVMLLEKEKTFDYMFIGYVDHSVA